MLAKVLCIVSEKSHRPALFSRFVARMPVLFLGATYVIILRSAEPREHKRIPMWRGTTGGHKTTHIVTTGGHKTPSIYRGRVPFWLDRRLDILAGALQDTDVFSAVYVRVSWREVSNIISFTVSAITSYIRMPQCTIQQWKPSTYTPCGQEQET